MPRQPTEIESLLAQHRAFNWTKADTGKVATELWRFGLLRPDGISNRWSYKMAYNFARSHEHGIDTIDEAIRHLNRCARDWAVSFEYVVCVFAMGHLIQDTITYGFTMGMALSISPVVREPFCLLYNLGVETNFWKHMHDEED